MTKENMILLHEMTAAQEQTVQQLLATQRGCALVLVHPIYFGWTEEERRTVIEGIVAHTPNPDATVASDIRSDQDGYLLRLRQGVTHQMFRGGVGFVFEEENRLERVGYLQSLNSSLKWVVIPTLNRRAQPKYPESPRNNVREWQDNLTKMQVLGLKQALVGGCYGIFTSEGEPVRNEGTRVGCVNEAYFKMLDSRLFPQVQIAGLVTYGQDMSFLSS